MKSYLILFREEVYSGAMGLFKRLILPNLLIYLILIAFGMLLIFPLYFLALGLPINGVEEYRTMVESMRGQLMDGAKPEEVIPLVFSNLNYTYLLLTILTAMLFYAWAGNLMFTLNDTEIRHGDRNPLRALAASFNIRVLHILYYFILYAVASIIVLVFYSMLTGILMGTSKALGILFAFVGYFAMLLLFLRFSLGIPAIVHGHKNALEALAFSFKNLKWKRAAILLLLLLAVMVLMFIIMLMVAAVGNAFAGILLMYICMFALAGLSFSALSALYFRYSDDLLEAENSSDHLISE